MSTSLATPQRKRSPAATAKTARTIRLPNDLRERILSDAERCGRSFEGQVVAILRRHFGEDVDIAPPAEAILSLARGSLAGVAEVDRRGLLRRLDEFPRR